MIFTLETFNAVDNACCPIYDQVLQAVPLIQVSVHELLHGLSRQLAVLALLVEFGLLLIYVVDKIFQLSQRQDFLRLLRNHWASQRGRWHFCLHLVWGKHSARGWSLNCWFGKLIDILSWSCGPWLNLKFLLLHSLHYWTLGYWLMLLDRLLLLKAEMSLPLTLNRPLDLSWCLLFW